MDNNFLLTRMNTCLGIVFKDMNSSLVFMSLVFLNIEVLELVGTRDYFPFVQRFHFFSSGLTQL